MRERVPQQRLGLRHLPDVLVRGAPADRGCAGSASRTRPESSPPRSTASSSASAASNSRDRLVDPADAPQLVPVHVPRVRHLRRHLRIGRAARQRLLRRGRCSRRRASDSDAPRSASARAPALSRRTASSRRRCPVRVPRDRATRPVPRAAAVLRRVGNAASAASSAARYAASADASRGAASAAICSARSRRAADRASRRRERLRARERLARRGRRVQLGVGEREPGVRDRERRIEPQRLVKRSRRFEPARRMQIRKALIVERLRLGRRGADRVVRRADAGANGRRPPARISSATADERRADVRMLRLRARARARTPRRSRRDSVYQ